ncbi:hypothetical protein PQH03_28665 [Ralstonia insidiosa]|jgi:hypothetical protein|uniref:Uncharacterized protein n=1 Tax=Ralstonia insidiosa TaxID=190721 RepID=A0A192A814_9RALS|nr:MULTISPECIES: hypothetical protein [Ralstonia]KMW47594.1 hypothetical protein AC240_08590 [Ralstonia sp. MD27]ANJ76483.1 hypothetical protein A9Y76_28245 [Ralstonia insidiosa]MBA9869658.1 hypothetical protein [Ralstonia insidiosa]MBA9884419.1 hypothetical protein [Ralstonia pickettii]MBA9894093.1 hypothetical protein [Ralstonia pickettii]
MTSFVDRVNAPISARQRAMLERDARDLYGAAKRKGTTLDRWEHASEAPAAQEHFELGCWLYYFTQRFRSGKDDLDLRIDIVRRLFLAGLYNPGYMFFTVFDFGERQFDSIFEQGDAEQVKEGLRAYVADDRIRKGFEQCGWSSEGVQPALF